MFSPLKSRSAFSSIARSRALTCRTPVIFSGLPEYTGCRVCGERSTKRNISSGSSCALTEDTDALCVMISSTVSSPRSRTEDSMAPVSLPSSSVSSLCRSISPRNSSSREVPSSLLLRSRRMTITRRLQVTGFRAQTMICTISAIFRENLSALLKA